jgi:hypothetical protein
MMSMPGAAQADQGSAKRQAEIEQKQRDWLKNKGIE